MPHADSNDRNKSDTRKVPTFIGVGPPKCATTWLDDALRRHPDIFLPSNQKEVFYFDRFFDRGQAWYDDLFASAVDRPAVGEISTSYVLERDTIERIYSFNADVKLVCILRDPVSRMISHYRMFLENGRTTANLEDTLKKHPVLRQCSAYETLLQNVLSVFPREQLHLGIFEEILQSPKAQQDYLASLCDFLGVPHAPLTEKVVDRRLRETYGKPKSLWLVKKAKAVRSYLRRNDLESIVSLADRFGINRTAFLSKSEQPEIPDATRQSLREEFAPDVAFVEAFLGRKVAHWPR
ncbi:MAG: sulfotransferase [Pseudomonadota bacterium]